MKNKLLLILLFISCGVSAQIVNISDATLKAKLLSADFYLPIAYNNSNAKIKIDTNNDGEIQFSEAALVARLDVSDTTTDIVTLSGIEAFVNLKSLNCSNQNLTSIDVSMFPLMATLTCAVNENLTSITLSGNGSIKELNFGFTNIQSINLSTLEKASITNISCFNTPILALPFPELVNLKKLQCDSTPISTIDLSNCPQVDLIYCRWMPNLTVLNLANKPNLYQISCVGNTQLNHLDLSSCPIISHVETDCSFINLKNGIGYADTISISGNSDFVYLCVDDHEQDFYTSYFANTNVLVNSYCSFVAGPGANTIKGTFTFDNDNNGCTETDLHPKNIKVLVSYGSELKAGLSNNSGKYQVITSSGSFTVTPNIENTAWFSVSPATASVSFNGVNATATRNFCITPNGVHPDVEVVIVPIGTARPGFDAHYKIIYKNKGNQTLSGAVNLTYDDAVLDYVSATPAYTTAASGQLSWNYSNLAPFENREINVVLNLNGPMETPSANIGDALNYTVAITPTTDDETPADNTFAYKQIVVGSYDPNDISCLEGDVVHPDKIGQYLHYNINFENTGTAPATFIVVKDIINAQQFDVNTLQVMSASHNVETRVTDNKVEFIFDDINLGAQGKGNVVFKIKTKPTVALNSTVTQKADIFFDYNWPIVTNDANTTFTILSRGDFAIDNSVKIYPNPVKDVVNVEGSAELKSIQLYDVQGRLLQSVSASGLQSSVNVAAMPKGIYFIKAFTEKGTKLEKIIKE